MILRRKFHGNTVQVIPTVVNDYQGYLNQVFLQNTPRKTQVDREGRRVAYATAPVLWGAESTVSQHSFHQLLHQGTQVVPVDFIDLGLEPSLTANARAQADALAFGTDDPKLPPHRRHPGNRPSSMLTLDGLSAANLGRLIALYEHKVFVQGVIWNVNSFDQWGVELGKEMARRLLTGR